MFELLFFICMIWIFGKLLLFGIKAAWGITKLVFFIVFLPIVLLGLVLAGLLTIAFPLLLIIGILMWIIK